MKSLCLLAAFSLPPAFFGCLNSPMVHTSLNGPTSAGQPLATKLTQIIERPAIANRPRLTDRANPQDRAVSAILSGDYSGRKVTASPILIAGTSSSLAWTDPCSSRRFAIGPWSPSAAWLCSVPSFSATAHCGTC